MKKIVNKLLLSLARKIVAKYNPDIVGIVGSIGKTSVKEISSHLLQSKFRVWTSHNSYDTAIGLILTVFNCNVPQNKYFGWFGIFFKGLKLWIFEDKNYPEILLLELGAAAPGDLKYLENLLKFNIMVITAITPTHLQNFKTVKKIVQENKSILASLPRTSVAILNHDDSEVINMKQKTEADVISFGLNQEANICASDVNFKINAGTGLPEGMIFKVTFEGSVVPILLPGVLGEHLIYPVLAAIGVALTSGMHLVEISEQMKSLVMPSGRMKIIAGIKNTYLLDDSYNSSPIPLKYALQTLAKINNLLGRKIAVLGDMLQLGKETESLHEEIGKLISDFKIDFLITVGEAGKIIARSTKEHGLSDNMIASFNSAEEAGRFLQEKMKENDLVLIKGSRNLHLEKVVKEVMAEPERAGELLVS